MKNLFLTLFLLFAACGEDADDCNPAGTWTVTVTFGAGDCIDPGTAGTETWTIKRTGAELDITQADGTPANVETFDADTCSAELAQGIHLPETDLTWEIAGIAKYTLTFEGSTATGAGELVAAMNDGNDTACLQAFNVDAEK